MINKNQPGKISNSVAEITSRRANKHVHQNNLKSQEIFI
jgi:hypothetical protein